MPVAALLLVATGGLLASILIGRIAARLWLMVTLISVIAGFAAGVMVLVGGGNEWEWRSAFLVGGEPLHLRLDAISAFFLVLLCVIGGAGAIYGREYWSSIAHPRSARSGLLWWSVLLLSLGAVLLVSNGNTIHQRRSEKTTAEL